MYQPTKPWKQTNRKIKYRLINLFIFILNEKKINGMSIDKPINLPKNL
tara:strand:+ start:351 stop:494 length:144 start_codon:yes stop_codon:yes gene_type:complete